MNRLLSLLPIVYDSVLWRPIRLKNYSRGARKHFFYSLIYFIHKIQFTLWKPQKIFCSLPRHVSIWTKNGYVNLYHCKLFSTTLIYTQTPASCTRFLLDFLSNFRLTNFQMFYFTIYFSATLYALLFFATFLTVLFSSFLIPQSFGFPLIYLSCRKSWSVVCSVNVLRKA